MSAPVSRIVSIRDVVRHSDKVAPVNNPKVFPSVNSTVTIEYASIVTRAFV